MIKVFNNIKEIKKYYDKKTNTYDFRSKKGQSIEQVILTFDLNVESDIRACNISAPSISAKNIHARDITVWDIKACDINALDVITGVIRARNIHTNFIESMDIYARDLKAHAIIAVNIYARDIVYESSCITYEDFKCTSIKCTRPNPMHFSKYRKLEVIEDDD